MQIDPADVDPRYLKISFLPREKGLSRRDLLFGLLRPHYEIVPAIEQDRCIAWRGCSLCVASCPQGAISLKEGSASIDKDKCTACGACLPSCPEGAISSPLLDPEVLDASLQSLLHRDQADLEPRVLVIASEDSHALLEAEVGLSPVRLAEFKLPCIGAISSWLLLRSFDLGADGVAVVPCGPTCRHRCQPERWQGIIRFIQALLTRAGMEAERLRVFPFSNEEPRSPTEALRTFVEDLKQIGPSRLGDRNGGKKQLNLVALINDLSQRFDLDGACLSGDEIPFGIVSVKSDERTCTLCGACPDRCPTGAITIREGAERSQLLFDHSRCIACEACVRVCPEQVLRMSKRLDFSRFGKTAVLSEDRMAHCRRCGKEIAPHAMMRKIEQQLAEREGSILKSLTEFCPDCRIFGHLHEKPVSLK